MILSEIESYKDTLQYVGIQLAQQSQVRKIITIELNRTAFFKLAKFIQFCIRHHEDERWANRKLPEDLEKYEVRINGLLTRIIRI